MDLISGLRMRKTCSPQSVLTAAVSAFGDGLTIKTLIALWSSNILHYQTRRVSTPGPRRFFRVQHFPPVPLFFFLQAHVTSTV
jgi:hypothetical protein